MSSRRGGGGGAGPAGGFDFQERICAWLAVQILAGTRAAIPSIGAKPVVIRCETPFEVDDLFLEAADGGLVFIQAKQGLEHSARESSEYASCIRQGVELFTGATPIPGTQRDGRLTRPFSPETDRILIAIDPTASGTLRLTLHAVLGLYAPVGPVTIVDTSTLSAKQREVLKALRNLVRSFWLKAAGVEPTDTDIDGFLRCLDVQTLDLRNDIGESVSSARTLLIAHVLTSDAQAYQAWSSLVDLGANATKSRLTLDEVGIRTFLYKRGIAVGPSTEFRADVAQLKRISTRATERLAQHTTIHFGALRLRLSRGLAQRLLAAAYDQGLVVVGDPGVGKSAELYGVLAEAVTQDLVVLSADEIRSRTPTEFRTDLGLEHDLPEILSHWPGTRPGLLVVDGLDAVRGAEAARLLAEIITTVQSGNDRWRVLASIRRYDLRQSRRVHEAFAGGLSPADGLPVASEFVGVRHAVIPPWTDAEVAEASAPAGRLHQFVTTAPPRFRELIQIPFNLRLAADLLAGANDQEAQSLRGVTTQVELLDVYWERRVREGHVHADVRDALLRQLATDMLDSGRLVASRPTVADASSAEALDRLLSNGVLREWSASEGGMPLTHALAFSHHVLFDYALARLRFRGVPDRLHAELSSRRRLPLMARPSIELHYRHLWATDRVAFWACLFDVCSDLALPVVARIVGPSMLSELAKTMGDAQPLVERLIAQDPGLVTLQAARQLAARLTLDGAAHVLSPENQWCQFTAALVAAPAGTVILIGAHLLDIAVGQPDAIPAQQEEVLAEAACSLLEWAWNQDGAAASAVRVGLQAVCRSFEGSPARSRVLLMRALQPAHLVERGHQELFWLGQELGRLARVAPDIVREAYSAAFSNRDEGQDPVPFGTSRVMPMRSHRAQDYEGGRYALVQQFNVVIQDNFALGLKVVSAAIEGLLEGGELRRLRTRPEIAVEVAGEAWRFTPDGSSWWVGPAAGHHELMLGALTTFLNGIAGDPTRTDELVEAIRLSVSLASIWKCVLMAAAAHPATLGRRLLPVALLPPFLTADDIRLSTGELIKAVHARLPYEERRRIERLLLAIPSWDGIDRDRAALLRNAFLTHLHRDKVSLPAARKLLEQMDASGEPPPTLPPESLFEWTSKPWTEEDQLRSQNLDVERPANAALIEAYRPLRFTEEGAAADRDSIVEAMRATYTLLKDPELVGADEDVVVLAWQHLACGAKRVAEQDLSDTVAIRDFVKTVLLDAAKHPRPRPELHTSDFLSDNSVRWDAAMGLMRLASCDRQADPEVLAELDHLAEDPHPFVRVTVIADAVVLEHNDPDLMWAIVNRVAHNEANAEVISGLLSGIWRLIAYDHNRVRDVLLTLLGRPGVGDEQAPEIVALLAALYAWYDDKLARDVALERLLPLSLARIPIARNCIRPLRHAAGFDLVERKSGDSPEVRRRAFELLERVTRAAGDRFSALRTLQAAAGAPDVNKEMGEVAELADAISTDILLLCRPFKDSSPTARSAHELRQLLPHVRSLLIDLARVPAAPIVHDMVQTLEVLMDIEPAVVLVTLRNVLEAARADLYSYDSTGADLILKIAQRYLADYQDLVIQDEECQHALLDVLDEVVEAGWPRAYEMVAGLDAIFR